MLIGTILGFVGGFATAFYVLPKSSLLAYFRRMLRQAEAPGPDVEVDVRGLGKGQSMLASWKDRTVLVQRRTDAMLRIIEADDDRIWDPESEGSIQPESARNPYRSLDPEIFVVDLTCTHLGCPVSEIRRGQIEGYDFDGFLCSCHGGQFDLSGRVFKGNPAPANLRIPPYHFKDDGTLVIGSGKG